MRRAEAKSEPAAAKLAGQQERVRLAEIGLAKRRFSASALASPRMLGLAYGGSLASHHSDVAAAIASRILSVPAIPNRVIMNMKSAPGTAARQRAQSARLRMRSTWPQNHIQ